MIKDGIMKKLLTVAVVMCVGAGLVLTGCEKKAATGTEAISKSDTLKTVDEKVKYLVGRANAFVNSKQYDQAIVVAQYILNNLKKDSAEAKSIIQKAAEQLKAEASKAVNDLKTKLPSVK